MTASQLNNAGLFHKIYFLVPRKGFGMFDIAVYCLGAFRAPDLSCQDGAIFLIQPLIKARAALALSDQIQLVQFPLR